MAKKATKKKAASKPAATAVKVEKAPEAVEELKPGRIYELDPAKVVIDDSVNGRFQDASEESIQEMARTIAREGQLQPVIVREVDGDLHLVFGFRRAKAIKLLNATRKQQLPLMAMVREFKSDDEAFLANVAENENRQTLSPMDTAQNIQRMLDGGMTWAQVQRRYGKSKTWVGAQLSLLKLPDDLQEKIDEGLLKPTVAVELYEAPEAVRKEGIKKLREGESLAIADVDDMRDRYSSERASEDGKASDAPAEADADGEGESGEAAPEKPKKRGAKTKTAKAASLKQLRALFRWLVDSDNPYLGKLGAILEKRAEGKLVEKGAQMKLTKFAKDFLPEVEEDEGEDGGGDAEGVEEPEESQAA